MIRIGARLLSASAIALASTSAIAAEEQAQAADTPAIADIVVTARRQAETMQRTPIAVTALGGATLEKMNIQQVDQIAQATPNLIFSQQSSSLSAASVTIRGIGQTDPSLALDTAVGIYLDGVYVARSAGAVFDLVDPERIEVLRGPQGTLFGRNTTGGAIQIISKKPADSFGATVRGGYGSRDFWYLRGRVDTGRIADSPISAAVSYQHREKNGYFNNYLTPKSKDPGSLNVDSVSAQVSADLGALQIYYGFDWDERNGAPAFFQTVALSPDALAYYGRSESLGGAPLQYQPDQRMTSGYQQPGAPGRYTSLTRSQGHNLTVSYDVSDALTLKSIFGYRKLYMDNVLGLSGQGDLRGLVLDLATGGVSVQPVSPYNGYNGPQKQNQVSEELQASGKAGDFSYVAGLYFFREKVSEDNHQQISYLLPGGMLAINLDPIAAYEQTSKSYAAFGQVSWKPGALDERFELTGGIRYTKDKKSVYLMNSEDGFSTVVGPDRGNASFSNVSFLVSGSYRFTDDVMGYAKFSTGYKSGGFNPRADRLNSFQPEKLSSWEIGIKGDFLDHRLRTNIAAFYSKYSDLQVPQFASGAGGATTLLVNAGKADFKGIELEVTAVPVRGLTLSGSLGYTDPKYKEFLFRDPATDIVTDIADTARFPNVAKFNSNIAAEYSFPPMDLGTLSARIAYAYRSQMYFYPNDAVNPYNEQVKSPATNTVSARIALSDISIGGRAVGELAVAGDNLLNEDQVLYGIDFGGLGFGGKFYNEPRRVTVEFKVTY